MPALLSLATRAICGGRILPSAERKGRRRISRRYQWCWLNRATGGRRAGRAPYYQYTHHGLTRIVVVGTLHSDLLGSISLDQTLASVLQAASPPISFFHQLAPGRRRSGRVWSERRRFYEQSVL